MGRQVEHDGSGYDKLRGPSVNSDRMSQENFDAFKRGAFTEFNEIEAVLAEALGYEYDENYGWVIGEHTPQTLAMELAGKYKELKDAGRVRSGKHASGADETGAGDMGGEREDNQPEPDDTADSTSPLPF